MSRSGRPVDLVVRDGTLQDAASADGTLGPGAITVDGGGSGSAATGLAADETAATGSAAPGLLDVPPRPVGLGWLGWGRWCWRTLTSMRVALLLLALLALAAVPGSVLPQRGVGGNPAAVRRFLVDNPLAGPWLDRFGFFEVYSAPWFAAIYLLLLVSMTGCVLPRCAALWRSVRAQPVRSPTNLTRMDVYRTLQVTGVARDEVLALAATTLRRRRFRTAIVGGEVRAEKGYVRELGNLGFHSSLLVLLFGVAAGALFGYEGRVIVAEGRGFANSVSQYDEISPGPLLDRSSLEPFSFTLDDFSAEFEPTGPQRGSPRDFLASITLLTQDDAEAQQREIAVNAPLVVGGTKVFLTGNGYAPEVTVRDGAGQIVLSGPVVFLPRDGNLTSEGVIKAPDAEPTQLGFQGLFLPTAAVDQDRGPYSSFPAPVDPQLVLAAWTGDLGLSDGEPQSVYRLDTSAMQQVESGGRPFTGALRPGETLTLPDRQGSLTFDGVSRFANFQIAHDPGRIVSLAAAVLLLVGLTTSLLVNRRRTWVRVSEDTSAAAGEPTVLVEVAVQSLTRRGPTTKDLDALLVRLGMPHDQDGARSGAAGTPTFGPDARRQE